MKKIFTLLFFVGFLTSAFARQERHQQYGNQPNDNKCQSPGYSGNNDYGYSYSGHDGYDKNDRWNRRDNGNDYSYDNRRDHRNREDMRRNQYAHPAYQKTIIVNQYPARPGVPLIKILFGIGGLFN